MPNRGGRHGHSHFEERRARGAVLCRLIGLEQASENLNLRLNLLLQAPQATELKNEIRLREQLAAVEKLAALISEYEGDPVGSRRSRWKPTPERR